MGTCKINGFCPASINVKIQKKCIHVQFLPVHIGHKNELKHIRLTSEDRRAIATQLVGKAPHEEILKGIRSSLTNCDLQRIHLINKKDILNIEKSFNLQEEAVKHPFDPVSIEIWVRSLKASNDTALLKYKPQGVTSVEFSGINKDDFLLIYMTEAQKILFQKFGHDTVCIDGTHGLNNYNFQLYTMLILDESREGFPVAFMFSNRGDELIFSKFFDEVKNVTGVIQPNVFMSDMEETFYTAWLNIMGTAKSRYFCTWHVLKAWRGNINSKIKTKDKRTHVYNILKTLLYELDIEGFKKLLEGALGILRNDEDTFLFYEYFEKYYVNNDRFKCWAYCFRINAGINTNMSLENFNKVLKYIYLRGKKVKRLDKTLCAILNLLKDKLFDLIIKMKKGKLVAKLHALRKRHKNSLLISFENVVKFESVENKWHVLSSGSTEFYVVKRIKECKNCQLMCMHCNSCFHEFVCSCMDSSIKNNMCKHIHAVAQQINSSDDNSQETEKDEEKLVMDIDNNENLLIEQSIINEISCETDCHNVDVKKNKMLEEYQELGSFLHKNISTLEQIDYVRKEMKKIMTTIDAMNSTTEREIQVSVCFIITLLQNHS